MNQKIVRNQQCRNVSSAHLLHHDQEWKLHELGCLVKTPDVSSCPDPTLFTSLNSATLTTQCLQQRFFRASSLIPGRLSDLSQIVPAEVTPVRIHVTSAEQQSPASSQQVIRNRSWTVTIRNVRSNPLPAISGVRWAFSAEQPESGCQNLCHRVGAVSERFLFASDAMQHRQKQV